jgi:extracellular solute-binding protein (family 5)
MSRAAITLCAVLLLLVLSNSTLSDAVQGSTSADLTYPSNFWNSSNTLQGPYVSKIVTRVQGYSSRLSDIESGSADAAASLYGGFNPADEASLCSTANVECRTQDDLGFAWTAFNQRSWCDPSLAHGCDAENVTQYLDYRLAIDYAIPRANIVATQLLGNGLPTCQFATPAWSPYFDGSLICNPTGAAGSTEGNTTQIWAHLNTLTVNFPAKFAWATGAACSGFPTNTTSGQCFTNVTAGRPIQINLLTPNYDAVQMYAGTQIAANLQKAGFDLFEKSVPFSPDLLNALNNFDFNQMILSFIFTNNIPDVLFTTFDSSLESCPLEIQTVPCGSNFLGVHDSVLDGYVRTIHTSTSVAAVATADKNALERIYNQAWFLTTYSRKLISAVRTDLYHGYFNEPGQGTENPYAFNWEFMKLHSIGCLGDNAPTLLQTSCDNPTRPLTVDTASGIAHVNPWETLTEGSVWDSIVASATGNQAAPSSGAVLNLLDPNTYALTPWVSPLPTVTLVSSGSMYPGTSIVCAPVAPATSCEQITYTITNQAAFIGNGRLRSAAGPRFVTAADYKATLDYAFYQGVPAFADLQSVTQGYSASGNTLTIDLNSTGLFRLYETNLQPTDARYWCTTSACTVAAHTWVEEPTIEAGQLTMLGNSTTGPFVVTLHNLTTGEIDYAQNPYYLQNVLAASAGPKCTEFHYLMISTLGCTIPSPTFGLTIIGSLAAIPAIAIASKRRRRSTRSTQNHWTLRSSLNRGLP